MNKYFKKIETNIKKNKMFLGLLILFLNTIHGNIKLKLSPLQKSALDNVCVRWFILFCILFSGTKDIATSLLLTFVFFILFDHLLHEESIFSIIPNRFKRKIKKRHSNDVTKKELDNAIKTLRKVKRDNNF